MQCENLNPKVALVIMRQVAKLTQKEHELDGIHVLPQDEENASEVLFLIRGPEKTPYEGGGFRVKLTFGPEFPVSPPKGFFLTKIFHPNISERGEICLNTLKRDWNPADWRIDKIMQTIRCLMIVPFPESALNEEAGRMIMESYDEYAEHAKMISSVHAKEVFPGKAELCGESTKCSDTAPTETVAVKKKVEKAKAKTKKSLKRL